MKKGKHRTTNIEHRTPNCSDDARELTDFGGYVLCEGKNDRTKFNLEERLLEFASAVIDLSEMLPNTRKAWAEKSSTLLLVLRESDELIRIFMASIRTARQNALLSRRKASGRVTYASSDAG